MKVIFILGSGHCGSTLLDLLLDSHSAIAGVGEFAWKDSMTLTDPFWDGVFDERPLGVVRSKLDFVLARDSYLHPSGKFVDIPSYRNRVFGMYQKVLDKAEASVIADSSKNPDFAELLSKDERIEPIFIHLVRDGRAVTWSYMKKYPGGYPLFKWFLANIKVSLLMMRAPGKKIFLRYEDLVRDPKRELSKILAAAELPFEEGILNYRSFTHHQIGGNRMKSATTEEIRSDDGWRANMPLQSRALFTLLFGWLNAYYRLRT